MATSVERKFVGIRKRLDQLGYRQPLGVESLPLVERLVADLLHTTESLKTCKLQVVKNKEQKGLWQQHVQPYRHDNARLTQENLELHQKLMRMKETAENRKKDLKTALRRLEHENTDLKFLNTQYMQKLLIKEKESTAKSERILQLQEKNSQAVVHTPGGRKRNVPFHRQRMEIDCTLPAGNSIPRHTIKGSTSLPVPELYVVDLVKVADDSVAKLKDEITVREKEKANLLDSVEDLKKQVDRREKEIERLSSQLRGGRPPEALDMARKIDGNERVVSHLNIQVDFLQRANMELEKQLQCEKDNSNRLNGRVEELSNKNSHICTELQEIGDLVKEMERERKESEAKLKEEVIEWKTKLQELKAQQVPKEEKMFDKMQECDELLNDNRRMAKLLATFQDDTNEATRMIETLSTENKLMKKQLHQTGKSCNLLLHVQRERDELKGAVKEFELQLMQIQEEAKSLTQDRDNFKILYEQVNEELHSSRRGKNATDCLERDTPMSGLEHESLKGQSELTKREGEEGVNEDLSYQLERISQERDELKKRINSLQECTHQLECKLKESRSCLTEVIKENKELKSKVHSLQGLLDSAEKKKSEQKKGLQEQVVYSENVQLEIIRLKSVVKELEQELQNSRVKENEKAESLKQLDQDYDSLRMNCDRKDEELFQLGKEKDELSKGCAYLKMELEKVSHAESTAQIQLQAKECEITSMRQRLTAMEEEGIHLQTHGQEQEKHLTQLKEDLATMAQECQAVNAELRKAFDERSELREMNEEYGRKCLNYEELRAAKEQEMTGLIGSYQALSQEVERLDKSVQHAREQESLWQLELSSLEKKKHQLEELCQQQTTEIEQHVSTLQSYEIQLSNLTNAMSRMEQNLRQEQEEKKALLLDLSSVRELCVQIERTKESLTRQLASQSLSHEQTCSDVEDITAERDMLRQRLASEQAKTENLETLLSHQRKKEFHSDLSSQERDSEIQHLKQQIARLETDNTSHKEQVYQLRGDASVKTEELERLKAELTAEKFQREHVQEQVKKLRIAVGGTKMIKTTPIATPLHLDKAVQKSKEDVSFTSAH